MQVHVSDIPAEGLPLSGELPLAVREQLAHSLQADVPPLTGHYTLRLARRGARIDVVGTVHIEGQLPCSSCLAPAQVRLQVPLAVGIVPQNEEPPALEGGEVPAEGTELYTYTDETLPLPRVLHDEIVMELPQRLLCRPDCRGLCSQCGQLLNTAACACAQRKPAGPLAALAQWRPNGASKKA